MPETQCYAMVRGSAVRVTGLGPRGSVPDKIRYAVSKSVSRVTINEVTESGSSEALGSEQNDNDTRLRLVRPEQTINYTVDIDFIRCDPGILNIITGAPPVYEASAGFGEVEFGEATFGGGFSVDSVVVGFEEAGYGEGPFGGIGVGSDVLPTLGFGGDIFGESFFGGDFDTEDPHDEGDTEEVPLTVVGFDAVTRQAPVSFALEVWSRLTGRCAPNAAGFDVAGYGEDAFGGQGTTPDYGYTLFPFLRGGRLSGFSFKNGLVSFSIKGAQTRRGPRWAVGPYDLEGSQQRLLTPVSRNTYFRQQILAAAPPAQADGVQETVDVIDGGTATVTTHDGIFGGNASSTSPWIINGGKAV